MFTAGKRHRRHVLAIRNVGETVVVSANAYEFLGAIIVRRKLGVANGPIITEAIVSCCFEIEIRQTPTQSSPVERLTSHDPGADPHERFAWLSCVRVFGVFNVKVTAVVRRCVLHPLFLLLPPRRAETAIHHLIWPCMSGEVALWVDWRSGFEN